MLSGVILGRSNRKVAFLYTRGLVNPPSIVVVSPHESVTSRIGIVNCNSSNGEDCGHGGANESDMKS